MLLLNRRRFLRSGAAFLFAAPFARMIVRPAAACTGAAKRLLVFFSPNGTIHSWWRPEGSETDFSFASGSVLESLTPYKDQLLILDHMDFYNADNHEGGMAAMLTGNGTASSETAGMSLDQYVAAMIGGSSRFSSLELGALTSLWGGSAQTRMSYSGPDDMVTPDDDPEHVYTRLFGDLAGGPEAAAQILARRQSVLDLVMDEITELETRLGAEEKVKLEAHLESLRAVERSLSGGGSCETPDPPTDASTASNDSFPDLVQSQIDLAVLALACGSTSVATVQCSHTISPVSFSWLGISEGHHSLSHADDTNTSGVSQFIQCERWFAEQFATLVERLAAASDPETGESLLDTTVTLWAKELGDGRMHTCTDVPWIIAGSAGGTFRTGRTVDLAGATQHRVLVSICQALGLTNETFGDPDGGSGPLEELCG